MEAHEQPVRLRVSPLGYLAGIVAGVLLLVMVGLLTAQLLILKDSREHIQAQDHKIATLQGQVEPVLEDTRPALQQAEPLLRRARRLLAPAGDSLASLTEAADTVPRLAAGADLLLGESIPLVQALNAQDLPATVAIVTRLARAMEAAGVPQAVQDMAQLARALADNERAVRAIDATNRLIGEIEGERLIPRTSQAIPRFEDLLVGLLHVQKRTLRVQGRSFRIQVRQLRTQTETLAIQREALEHIRSIDRKTGPAPPATPVTPAAP